jgi:hypothetical protein
MKLTEEQQAAVREWVEQGATLNDVQNRLREEMDIRMTFMDVRFLILDLGVELHVPKAEVEEKKPEESPSEELGEGDEDFSGHEMDPPGAGGVNLTTDAITLPGCMASGKVAFSDGVVASWFIDEMGRLAVQPPVHGYQPPVEDVPSFQAQLQAQLQKLGLY